MDNKEHSRVICFNFLLTPVSLLCGSYPSCSWPGLKRNGDLGPATCGPHEQGDSEGSMPSAPRTIDSLVPRMVLILVEDEDGADSRRPVWWEDVAAQMGR